VRVSVDFIYLVLHSIYIPNCYRIFTRLNLHILIVPVTNCLQLSRRRNGVQSNMKLRVDMTCFYSLHVAFVSGLLRCYLV